MLYDLTEDGQKVVIANGGVGGRGNWQFRSSTNTTPRQYEAGTKGERKTITLELKVLAQIGLVGLPNAGKSTLLAVLTNAKPKIANYPFTTLTPNLGVLRLAQDKPGKRDESVRDLVIADIPGLIEGASDGKGLGIQFLRHIERCRILLYVVGPTNEVLEGEMTETKLFADFWRQYEEVRQELGEYKKELLALPSLVVVNKIDLFTEKLAGGMVERFAKKGVTGLAISAVTGAGVENLKQEMGKMFGRLEG
jgi:GTP-binding protein